MDKSLCIVGHGLAGCVLGLTCFRRNLSFKIIGASLPGEASMASSGLIAPITGRRYVKAWRIDEFIKHALEFYRWTEELLGDQYFFPVEIVRFLSNPEAIDAWMKRLNDPEYKSYISNKKYDILDELERPYGILTGGFRLDTPGWLDSVRKFLMSRELMEINKESFDSKRPLEGKIIFATGAADPSVAHGIIPNKGEALIVSMPDWKIPVIVKEEVFIVPLGKNDLYWVGSYYQPWPNDSLPSVEGKDQILKSIQKVYTGPLEVISHLVGVRPTVDDRRPLIGKYPGRPEQYIFNGMGTKGTSLAPFWADQLISHITEDLPLPHEVSPSRYMA